MRRPRIFYGWWIVLGTFLVVVWGWGTFFYGFGVLFNPIRKEFGWSATTTALAFSLRSVEAGIAAPFVGILVDRLGPRRLMAFGVTVVGLGFLLMSQMHSLVQFYAAFFIISFGFSFATVGGIAVVNWFVKKRTFALAIQVSAVLPAGFIPPVISWLLDQGVDWRTIVLGIAVGTWVLLLPLSLLMRHRPEPYGMYPDGDAGPAEAAGPSGDGQGAGAMDGFEWREALATRTFWLICVAGILSGAAVGTAMVLIVPYLESVGIPRQEAALGVTLLSSLSVIGRLGFGWLGDRMPKRYLLAASYGLVAVGALLIAFVTKFWMVIPSLLFLGPGYGGSVPVRPAMTADYFGRRNYGTITGLMGTVGAFGGIAATPLAAKIYDTTGSYKVAWLIFAAIALVGTVLILFAKPPKREKAQVAPQPAPGGPAGGSKEG